MEVAHEAVAQEADLQLPEGAVVARFAGPQIIGRAEACSLQLRDIPAARENYLSRVHAALTHADGAWSLVDLGSTNGTFVNDKKLTPWVTAPLNDGDRVGLAGARSSTNRARPATSRPAGRIGCAEVNDASHLRTATLRP